MRYLVVTFFAYWGARVHILIKLCKFFYDFYLNRYLISGKKRIFALVNRQKNCYG